MALWQERVRREGTRTEVSTLVNEDQLERNRTYVTSIVDIIQFQAVNQLPFHGSVDALDIDTDSMEGLCPPLSAQKAFRSSSDVCLLNVQ